MTRHVSQRRLFALLDNRVRAAKREQLQHHINQCKHCQSSYQQIQNLQAWVKTEKSTTPPDWSRMDLNITQQIAQLPPQSEQKSFPLTLVLVPTAIVALSTILLFAGIFQSELDTPAKVTAPSVAIAPTIDPKITAFQRVSAQIKDLLKNDSSLTIGQQLDESTGFDVSQNDAVRLLFTPDTQLELASQTHLELVSLIEENPSVQLIEGRLSLLVAPFTYKEGFRVLSGNGSYLIFDGLIEFYATKDNIEIHVYQGEVFADSEAKRLGPGGWRRSNRLADNTVGWLQKPENLVEQSSTDAIERPIRRRIGRLPKRVVRQAFVQIRPSIRKCYEQTLKRNPNLILNITTQLTIDRTGNTGNVQIKGAEDQAEFGRCLIKIIDQMRFPQPQGGPVEVVFPLRLYPEG